MKNQIHLFKTHQIINQNFIMKTTQIFKNAGIVLLFVLFNISLQAQTFKHIYGTSSNEGAIVEYFASEQAYYMVGATNAIPFISKMDIVGKEVWSIQLATNLRGHLNSVQQMDDGNILVSGTLASRKAIFLAKISPAGNVLWEKKHERGGRTIGMKMVKSKNDVLGETYIIKHWKSSGGSSDDMAIVKIDNAGSIIWSKDYVIGGDDEVYDIVATDNGKCVITGSNSSSSWQMYVIEIGTNGNISKTKGFSSRETFPYAITTTYDGGYIVTGRIRRSNSVSNAFIMKLDNNLSIVWSKVYNKNQNLSFGDVVEDEDHNITVSSYETIGGNLKYTLIQFDENGNYLKAIILGNSSLTSFTYRAYLSQTQGSPNRLIVTDYTTSPSNFGGNDILWEVLDKDLENACEFENYTATVNNVTFPERRFRMNESATSYATSTVNSNTRFDLEELTICEADPCLIYLCGQNNNKVIVCHIPHGNPSAAHEICISPNALPAHLAHGDYCGPCKENETPTIELPTGSIKEIQRTKGEIKDEFQALPKDGKTFTKGNARKMESIKIKDVSIAPNPTSNILNIQLEEFPEEEVEISIFNIQGVQVVSTTMNQKNKTLDVTNLNNGIYQIQMLGKDWQANKKFVIVR